MTDPTPSGGYDALVFDMDGTLVEYTTDDLRREAAVTAFEAVGIDPSDDELRSVAAGSTENARGICRERGVEPDDFYEQFDPLLAERQHEVVEGGGKPPYDDALTALDRLGIDGDGPNGTLAAVLSNNYQSVVERTLDRHLPGHFPVAYGVPTGPAGRERRKPHAGYLRAVLADLDAAPDRTLVVGDGRSDVAVAAAVGVDCAHVERRGPHTGDEEPTHRIETLVSLPAIVDPPGDT